MIRQSIPVRDIVGRQKVCVTGWATEDIEKAELPDFSPQADDIVIEPTTSTVGFCVNIISAGTLGREIGELRCPVMARYETGTEPIIEIETFDWTAEQAPAKRLVKSIYTITPDDRGWLLDDQQGFNTAEEAVMAVLAKHGRPHAMSRRNDGGVNLLYQRIEDDPFEL